MGLTIPLCTHSVFSPPLSPLSAPSFIFVELVSLEEDFDFFSFYSLSSVKAPPQIYE